MEIIVKPKKWAIVVASVSALLVFAQPSEALARDPRGPYHAIGIGLTLSFSVGARPVFGIGGDLRYTMLIDETRWNEVSYGTIGAFAQATYLRGGAVRIAGGAHGGALLDDWIFHTDGELGLTYRSSFAETDRAHPNAAVQTKEGKYDPGGWGLHLGFSPQFNLILLEHGPIFRLNLGFSQKVKNEMTLGWEFRALPVRNFAGLGGHFS